MGVWDQLKNQSAAAPQSGLWNSLISKTSGYDSYRSSLDQIKQQRESAKARQEKLAQVQAEVQRLQEEAKKKQAPTAILKEAIKPSSLWQSTKGIAKKGYQAGYKWVEGLPLTQAIEQRSLEPLKEGLKYSLGADEKLPYASFITGAAEPMGSTEKGIGRIIRKKGAEIGEEAVNRLLGKEGRELAQQTDRLAGKQIVNLRKMANSAPTYNDFANSSPAKGVTPEKLKQIWDETGKQWLRPDYAKGGPEMDKALEKMGTGYQSNTLTKKVINNHEVFGAFAGFEKDDDGNIKFNPEKAAFGVAGLSVGKRVAPKLIQEEITVLNYSNKLKELGYNAKQIEKIGFQDGKKIIEDFAQKSDQISAFKQGIRNATNKEAYEQAKQSFKATSGIKEGLWAKFKSWLNPAKSLDEPTQKMYQDWSRKTLVAKEVANDEIRKLGNLGKEGIDTINRYESGKLGKQGEAIKSEFDKLFKEANERGLDVKYRENYIPHVYANKPEEVSQAMAKYLQDHGVSDELIQGFLEGKDIPDEVVRRLKLNPNFIKQRTFDTYEEAMAYGLTPKYDTIAQHLAHYRKEMETALANRDFLEKLQFDGKVMPAEIAPSHWKAINLPFSPKGFYAEPKLADMLNGIFKHQEGSTFWEAVFDKTAWLSKKMQEIALSAGVPKTHINFFSIGQLIKEITAGNFKSLVPFVRTFSNKQSIKYFYENREVLQKMANQGIDLGDHVGNWQSTNGTAKFWESLKGKKLTEKLGAVWHKSFDEKTFASFIPQMHVQVFKDAEKKFLNKGMSTLQAEQAAGEVVKTAFGLMENVGRSKNTENVLSSVFFAPKFREGVIRTLYNTGKSLTTEISNPAFYKNRRLAAGMVLTYGMYNAINKKLTGHYMWDNPDGKEFDLMIPLDNGDVTYIGFMPSFLAFARNLGSGAIATVKGDFSTAKQKFGSLFSMPLKVSSELWANKDYFGRPIYSENDDTHTKLLKMAEYAGLSVNHPFIKETYNQITGKKPLYQSVSEAMELPFKFSSYDKIQQAEFYDAMDKQTKIRVDENKKFRPVYDQVQQLVAQGKKDEAKKIVDGLTDQEYEVYKRIRTAEKSKETTRKEVQMYDTVVQIQKLLADGKQNEAQSIVDAMSDEDYRIYKMAKNKVLGK